MTRPLTPITPAATLSSETASSQTTLALEPLVKDYLDFLRHERGCAQTTRYHYASWLRLFLRWLADNGHEQTLTAFNTTVLRSYLYSMSRQGKRPRTILSAFNPIKGLGQFLTEHALLEHNPTKSLTYPKKDAAERLTVSTAEISMLLEAVERLPDARDIALARGLLSVLIYTGVRFDELRSLRLQDINLGNETLLVANGKGSKSRLLYPPQPCLDAIEKWIAVRERLYGRTCQHDWLWAYNNHQRIGEEGVRSLLEDVKAIAGLRDNGNIKPHSLRHAFATRMMQNGATLTAVKAALGHSLLSTTFQYLHLEEQETRKMADYGSIAATSALPTAAQPTKPMKITQAMRTRARRRTSL